MRKLLALLPIVAVAVAGSALVASAGFDEAPPAPATVGYTILAQIPNTDAATPDETATTDDIAATAEPDDASTGLVDFAGGDVGALQGGCEGQLSTVDLTTGVVTPLPAAPSATACAGDLTFGPDGTLYGFVRAEVGSPTTDIFMELVRFDTTTGAAELIGRITPFSATGGFSSLPQGGIAFDAQGQLFAELATVSELPNPDPACLGDDEIAFCLYRIDDPSNPEAAAFVGQSTGGVLGEGADIVSNITASCTTMYTSVVTINEEALVDTLRTVDTSTAALTEIGTFRARRIPVGMSFDRAGTFWGLELIQPDERELVEYELVTFDPAGGSPADTLVGPLQVPAEPGNIGIVASLAIEPLDCTPEILLAPTFTG